MFFRSGGKPERDFRGGGQAYFDAGEKVEFYSSGDSGGIGDNRGKDRVSDKTFLGEL